MANGTGTGTAKALAQPLDPDHDPLGRWTHRWGTEHQFIFTQDDFRPRPESPIVGPLLRKKGFSDHLSGLVVVPKKPEASINSVEAVWTIPNCYPPKSAIEGQWYTCSSWIGMDGCVNSKDASTDLLQVGVDSNVMVFGGIVTRWVCAWWQWVPGPSAWIPVFPVSAGDTLDAIVTMQKRSKTKATIYLCNRTRGTTTSFTVHAPGKTELKGDCAAWMVEKTELPAEAKRELASYGSVCFDQAKAYTDENKTPLRPGEKYRRCYVMQSRGKKNLSQAQTAGDLVRCDYQGLTPTDVLLARFVK